MKKDTSLNRDKGKGKNDDRRSHDDRRNKPDKVDDKHNNIANIALQIHEVKCIKTTKEIDKDEIVLIAIVTLGEIKERNGKKVLIGKSRRGQTIPVGKFKKGDSEKYKTPKAMATYRIGGNKQGWPQHYYATLLMIEKDIGEIDKIADFAIDTIDKQVTDIAIEAVGEDLSSIAGDVGKYALVGAILFPGVGPVLGAAIGTIVGLGVGAIKKAQGDEQFPPNKLSLILKEHPVQKGIIGDKAVAEFKAFNGEYKVIYSWYAS